MSTEWDEGQVTFVNRGLVEDEEGEGEEREEEGGRMAPHEAHNRFREFLRNFRASSASEFLYRDQLMNHFHKGEFMVQVELDHLNQYDPTLLDFLVKNPNVYHKILEAAAKEVLFQSLPKDMTMTTGGDGNIDQSADDASVSGSVTGVRAMDNLPDIQVLLRSSQAPTPLRAITATDVNRLLLIPGIIISTSRIRSKAILVAVTCKSCGDTTNIKTEGAFGGALLPTMCNGCKARNAMTIVPDRGLYVDQQTLKMQEAPEVVPTGEMPRSILLAAERRLVDVVSPGTRISAMGVVSVVNGGGSVRVLYIRVLGFQVHDEGSGRMTEHFTPAEEADFIELAREPDIYDKITRSIAPAISGDYTDDIKRAIACLLFSGSKKLLPDGMRIRGDLNVLLLGDPSTAKSQFLKFVERAAPIGVYTSGKGSSAAGLTASVIRDNRGEFYLEGGAMVLADGGVVCIDEFDKMREQDRVAIHEAMEQQTISIAKAGITTILNSRTSVLAAANPVFGTYNDLKSAAENIDFLPTILSRFDLIFIVRDVRDEAKDHAIARHVMDIHMNGSTAEKRVTEGEIDLLTLKKYIAYCKAKCAPCLNAEAAHLLQNHYVNIRENHRQRISAGGDKSGAATVPITVRQLEAIIRISESIAKMQLLPEATPAHVAEAVRLFGVSTLNAATTGSMPHDLSLLKPDQLREIQQIEEQLKRRIPVGTTIPTRLIQDELSQRQAYPAQAVMKAIQVMVSRNELAYSMKQRLIKRLR